MSSGLIEIPSSVDDLVHNLKLIRSRFEVTDYEYESLNQIINYINNTGYEEIPEEDIGPDIDVLMNSKMSRLTSK